MPRKPNAIKRRDVKVSLPEPLIERLDNHLRDPVTGRMPLFDRSRLFERLLREHLNKMEGVTLDDLTEEKVV